MKLYVENRVWSLYSKINKDTNFSEEHEINCDYAGLNRFSIKIEKVKAYTDNYECDKNDLKITFDKTVINKIKESTPFQKELDFLNFVIIITSYGSLSVSSYYKIHKFSNIDNLEKAGMKLSDYFDDEGLFRLVSSIVNKLSEIKLLSRSKISHFGKPAFITDKNFSEYGYLFHQHLISDSAPISCASENYLFLEEDASVYQQRTVFLWVVSNPHLLQRFEDFIFLDTLCLSEACFYNNATKAYTYIIEKVLNETRTCRPGELRNISINYNLAIQKLKLLTKDLTDNQLDYITRFRLNAKSEEGYMLFKDSEDYVKYAIDGLENSRSEKSGKIVQFILAFLTCLTLYSIVNDIHSFITSDDLVLDNIAHQTTKTSLLAGVTTLILFIMIIFRKSLKK